MFDIIFKCCLIALKSTWNYPKLKWFFKFFFQCLFAIFGLFVCRSSHSSQPARTGPRGNPDWAIIFGFTVIFVATYPLHMYLAEIYLPDSFSFLLAKYCIGFLFVVCIPILTLILRREIREGIAVLFGSAATCSIENEPNEVAETMTWRDEIKP